MTEEIKLPDHAIFFGGDNTIVTAGYMAELKTGDESTLKSGAGSALRAGDNSSMEAGDSSVLYGGHRCIMIAGKNSTFNGKHGCIAIVHDSGFVCLGPNSAVILRLGNDIKVLRVWSGCEIEPWVDTKIPLVDEC